MPFMIDKGQRLNLYQWLIFTVLFIGYGLYSYNRKCVALAMPKLLEQKLDTKEAGLISSSQNVAYAISKFVGGILSDQISSRYLFSIGLISSGLFTIFFSNSDSLLYFVFLWFMNGLAQGCGWPACAKLLRSWYDASSFGTWWSLLSASINTSGAISPFISAYLINNYGWRFSILVVGLVSTVFGFICLISIIDQPEDVGLVGFDVKKKTDNDSKKSKETVRDLLKSSLLWLVGLSYLSVFLSRTSVADWGQVFLMEDCQQSQKVATAFSSSLETGGFLGGIVAGWLTDIVIRIQKQKNLVSGRIPVSIFFMSGLTICCHLLYFHVNSTSSPYLITTIGFIIGACVCGPIALFGIIATETAPVHLSGTAHAFVALAANIGAIISGLPLTILANNYSWRSIFLLLECISSITVAILLYLVLTFSNDKRKKA